VRPGRTLIAFGLIVGALSSAAGCQEARSRELTEWTPADHPQPAVPDPTREPAVEDASPETISRAAAALWVSSCAGCHGVEGHGDGPELPGGAHPRDLATAEFQGSVTDPDIARAIRMGRGMMPAFGSQLNERGIAALVGHVRTLGSAE
jgi:mono/diheme cytochrome c family protein